MQMTFEEATEQFLGVADWLGPEHAPSVQALRRMATALDNSPTRLSSSMIQQYTMVHRALLALKPKTEVSFDEMESFLSKHAKA